MSVINQMLKDLDARGGGDAQRRAALAATGQGVHRAAPKTLSLRVAVLVAVLATAALAALLAWWLLPQAAVPPEPLKPAADVVALAAQPTDVAAPAAPTVPVGNQQPETPRLAASAPSPPVATSPVAAAPVAAAPVAPSPVAAPPASEAPAVPARSRIEVLPAADADPLAAVREALADGDAEAALRQLASARPRAAPVAEAEALEAAALQQLGRHEAAIAAYTRALRGEPDIGAWWAGLGISLEAAGRGDEALSAYREAQRRGPLDAALADYVGGRVEALSAADDSGAPSR